MNIDEAYEDLDGKNKLAELKAAGYTKKKCRYCKGTKIVTGHSIFRNKEPIRQCPFCKGEGGSWEAPHLLHR